MAERLHPGLYMNTLRSGVAPVQAASTSNGGFTGVTRRGPEDEATLVTSFPDFERQFGGFISGTVIPHHVYAFFSNQGARAYIVRVTPADAVRATGYIEGSKVDALVGTGDGTVKSFSVATAHNIKPSSLSIAYNPIGVAVVAAPITVLPLPDGVAGVGAVEAIAGRVLVASGRKIVPGTVTITTLVSDPLTVLYTDPAFNGILKDAAGDPRGFIDYTTGAFSISPETGKTPDAGGAITIGYTPEAAPVTVTDDGAGLITGTTLDSGTVDYETGDIAIVVGVASPAPARGNRIRASYTNRIAQIQATSKGDWGNEVVLALAGDTTTFDRTTASFSALSVATSFEDVSEETFAALNMTPSSPKYLATVINNEDLGSKNVDIVEPIFTDEIPSQLNGRAQSGQLGVGNAVQLDWGSTDGTNGTATIPVEFRTSALTAGIQPGSVSIIFFDEAGAPHTIVDDGDGNLTGDALDTAAPATYNVIDYDTGAFAFRTLVGNVVAQPEPTHAAAPTTLATSTISASYRLVPAATVVEATMALGSDGSAVTRTQLTSPVLVTDRKGVYALNRIDELMNIVVPDAAGDVSMIIDLLAEAERNNRWFIVVAGPLGKTPIKMQEWRRFTLATTSRFGALYYPHIKVADPVTNLPLLIAPGGHIAGAYARTDATKSVGKAPAGTVDGALAWCIGLERKLDKAEMDVLHPFQINSLLDSPQTGRAIWGARSLENPPADFRYLHATRLFEFLDKSIFDATHNQVFENVGPTLWASLKSNTEGFMGRVWQSGALKGETASAAFIVQCDLDNNPVAVQDAGEVVVDVWAAINKPGEFIRFNLRQKVNLGN